MWQIEDAHVDPGNRIYELNGFSGSPVWSLEADEKTIVGLFTSGVGRSIYGETDAKSGKDHGDVIILFYCLCHYAGLFISQFDCILELVFIVMQVCHCRSPSFLLDFCKVYQDNMKNKIPDQKFLNQHHAYTDKDVIANRFQTFLNKHPRLLTYRETVMPCSFFLLQGL